MKLHILANTPLGDFKSKTHDYTPKEIERLENLLESDLTYLSLESEKGNKVYFKKEVINNSVFTIVKED